MSNKSVGTDFEQKFAGVLAECWFWVHLFQQNKSGQPCDVIACRDGNTYLFDCKDCETGIFRLSRIEENQYNAMKLFDLTGNGKGMFAIRFPERGVYLVEYDRMKELQDAGFKQINATVCRTQGITLREWLDSFGERDDNNADHHWE